MAFLRKLIVLFVVITHILVAVDAPQNHRDFIFISIAKVIY